MNRKITTGIVCFMAAFLLLAAQAFAGSMDEKAPAMSSSSAYELAGLRVSNGMGEDLGTIDNVILGEDGRPTYFVVAEDGIYWGDLVAAYQSPAYVETGVRLIPVPASAVKISTPKVSAMSSGEPYWGDVAAAFQSPATTSMAVNFGPETVALATGETYWGDLTVAFQDAGAGIHPDIERHFVMTNITREMLAKAPNLSRDEWSKFASSNFQEKVHAYYEEEH